MKTAAVAMAAAFCLFGLIPVACIAGAVTISINKGDQGLIGFLLIAALGSVFLGTRIKDV